MRSFLLLSASLLLLSLTSLPTASSGSFDPTLPYPYLSAATFSSLTSSPAERVVLFYFSSSPSSASHLSMLNTVARRLRSEFPAFLFQHCDGDLPVNKAEFVSAGFSKGEWIFTSTPIEGIMKYGGAVSVADLMEHIRYKYVQANASDVLSFSSEDAFWQLLDTPAAHSPSDLPAPIFVKFFERWCEHCKRLAPAFAITASVIANASLPSAPAVRFMEVECSRGEEEKRFCALHDVKSYPVLLLFTGEDKVRYEEEERSVLRFDSWLAKQLPDYRSAVEIQRSRGREDRLSNAGKRREKAGQHQAPVSVIPQLTEERQQPASQPLRTSSAQGSLSQADKAKAVVAVPIAAATERRASSADDRLSAMERGLQSVQSSLAAIQLSLQKLLDAQSAA